MKSTTLVLPLDRYEDFERVDSRGHKTTGNQMFTDRLNLD
jgi:hypothetical protein